MKHNEKDEFMRFAKKLHNILADGDKEIHLPKAAKAFLEHFDKLPEPRKSEVMEKEQELIILAKKITSQAA